MNTLISHMLNNAKNIRKVYIIAAVLSLAVAFGVFFLLERPGITMTGDDDLTQLNLGTEGVAVVVPDEEPTKTYSVTGGKASLYSNGVLYFEPNEGSDQYSFNYNGSSGAPWYSDRASITAVKFADGLTTLGNYAFYGYSSLANVDLSECTSITSIGNYAFRDCDALTSVDLSALPNLSSIGAYAFYDCDNIEKVILGDKITTIPNYAFYSCDKLTSVEFGDESLIESIGERAFYGDSKLADFSFEKLTKCKSIDTYAFYNCDGLTGTIDLSRMEDLAKLGTYVFNDCDNIEKVILSNALTAIPDYAFYSCDKLTSVDLGGSAANITSIGTYAFYSTPKLTDFPFEELESCTSIGNYAFYGCISLEKADLSKMTELKTLGSSAFGRCASIKAIDLSNSLLTSIPNYAFTCCVQLASVDLPDTITSIGQGSFSSCVKLTDFPFEKLENLSSVYDATSSSYNGSSFSYNGTSYYEYYGSFANCNAFTTVDLSKTALTKIGGGMFSYCDNLKKVILREDVTSIGAYAFYIAPKLTDFPFDELENCTSIGNYAFYNCDGLSGTLDLSVMPKLTTLGTYVFNDCDNIEKVILGDKITAIPNYAFYSCDKLTTVDLGGSAANITSIGTYAFYGDTKLEDFPFEELTSLNSLGTFAFRGCAALKTVDLSNSLLTSIPNYAFTCCVQLESVDLPDTITSIGQGSFSSCVKLTDFPFEKLKNLSSVYDGSSTSYNSSLYYNNTYYYEYYGSFAHCYSLTSVDLSNTALKKIGGAMFSECNNLEEVIINAEATSIGTYAFYSCDKLKTVDLKNVTEIGNYAFQSDPALEKIDLSHVSVIGNYAFFNCYYLKECNLSSATSIGTYAFQNNYGISKITLSESLTKLDSYAFANCNNVRAINYNGKNLATLGTTPFNKIGYNNPGKLEINIGEDVDNLPAGLFNGTLIGDVHFAGVNDKLVVAAGVFSGVGEPLASLSGEYYVDEYGVIYDSEDKTTLYFIPSGLDEYTVPASVRTIKSNSCKMAKDLQSLTFEDISNVKTVEANAFAECKTLSSITGDGKTATTVSDATELFEGASIGTHVFYHTGLIDDSMASSELVHETLEVKTALNDNGEGENHRITASFSDYHDPSNLGSLDEAHLGAGRIPSIDAADVNDDIYYFLTGEQATLLITAQGAGANKDETARIYFEFSSDAVKFDKYIVGEPTSIISDSGNTFTVYLKRVEGTNLYYLEFVVPNGDTLSIQPVIYAERNFKDQESSVKVWIEIVDDEQAPLNFEPDKYQEAYWYTTIRPWKVGHNSGSNKYAMKAVEDEENEKGYSPKIEKDIVFTVSRTYGNSSNRDGFGVDSISSISYTNSLDLPIGVEWEEHILEAIRKGDYFVSGVSSPAIYLKTDKGIIMLAQLSSSNTRNITVELDDNDQPVISWVIDNSSLSKDNTTCSSTSFNITYNADEIFKITDEYDLEGNYKSGGEGYDEHHRITSHIKQCPEYVFAEEGDTEAHTPAVFEQTDDAHTYLGDALPNLGVEKKAVYNGTTYGTNYPTSGTNSSSYINARGGEDIDFYITVRNTGYIEDKATRVNDALPDAYIITPKNIERMFDDIYGKELVITITNAYQAIDEMFENGETTRTGVSGDPTGIAPELIGGDAFVKLGEITIKWADDIEHADCLMITIDGDSSTPVYIGEGQDFESVEAYFNSLNFVNISSTVYTCNWYLSEDNQTIKPAIDVRDYIVHATLKTTFERMTSDYRYYYPYSSGYLSVSSNYGRLYDEEIQKAYSYKSYLRWYYDYSINKSQAVFSTATEDDEASGGDGTEIEYTLSLYHQGNGPVETVPIHDIMTGDQSAIAPVEGNEDAVFITYDEDGNASEPIKLSEVGLRIHKGNDGKDYYILSKPGTYTGLRFGYDKSGNMYVADRVEVSASETNIHWYLDNLPEGTAYTYIQYKSVMDSASGDTINKGDLSTANKVYAGERAGRRIYESVTGSVTAVSKAFSKYIVTENAAMPGEKLEKATEIGAGETVTYRLRLVNKTEYDQAFTNTYDILPETYGTFNWSKDNVSMLAVSNKGDNKSWENWKISTMTPSGESGSDRFYIYWNDIEEEPTIVEDDPETDEVNENELSKKELAAYIRSGIVLAPRETLDIYVTLKFPDRNPTDSVWDDYEKESFKRGNNLTNSFYVDGAHDDATHNLKSSGEAILQKGVYGVYDARYIGSSSYAYNSSSLLNRGTRLQYFNRTSSYPLVTYYITLYNSGNARLYLTDMVDTLPKGFSFIGLCNTTTANSQNGPGSGYTSSRNPLLTSAVFGTVTDDNNSSVQYKTVYVTESKISGSKDANGDYFEKIRFKFSKSTGNINYDSNYEMCYLDKGEAISFAYTVAVPSAQYTEDIANNRVAMPYYDYNGAGFKMSPVKDNNGNEGVSIKVNSSEYPDSINDGGCEVKDDFWAQTAGFDVDSAYAGSTWLTSDVNLQRGTIIPGITKTFLQAIDSQGTTQDRSGGFVQPSDTDIWSVELHNTGTRVIEDYTVSDTMNFPFYFTGDVKYYITSPKGYESSATYYTNSSTGGDKSHYFLRNITFIDDNTGKEITQSLHKDNYDKENITIKFSTMTGSSASSISSPHSLKFGEEGEFESYWYGMYSSSVRGPDSNPSGYKIKFKLMFDIDEDYNCTIKITFNGKDTASWLSIAPGAHATMVVMTKLPSHVTAQGTYVNNAKFEPADDFNPDAVGKGAVVKDDNGDPVGVEASSQIMMIGLYSSTSWKTITDNSEPSNTASSKDSKNYIVLKWQDAEQKNEFLKDDVDYPPCSSVTYGLNIQNFCTALPMGKIVVIDNLPFDGDAMAHSHGITARNSEFMVVLDEIASGTFDEKFKVWDISDDPKAAAVQIKCSNGFGEAADDGEISYTIEFSTEDTDFDNASWDGAEETEVEWMSAAEVLEWLEEGHSIEDIRSFRVIVSGGEGIAVQHTLRIDITARMYGDVKASQIAWNNFGYKYYVYNKDGTLATQLSASSLIVGMRTAATPTITKEIQTLTDRTPVTAEELGATATFLVYESDRIEYTDLQDLLKKLRENNIKFTVMELTAANIDDGDRVSFDNCVEHSISVNSDGEYEYSAETTGFKWIDDKKYTFTEINVHDDLIFYQFKDDTSVTADNSFTIEYKSSGAYRVICTNNYNDYVIILRKTSAETGEILANAGFARYGMFTMHPDMDDTEAEQELERLWKENFEGYLAAVKTVEALSRDNEYILALSVPNSGRLDAEKVKPGFNYDEFSNITGTVTEIDDISEIGQYFSQIYKQKIENEDGTETVNVYYFIDYNTTDVNGTITYPSVIDDNYAFLEVAAPEYYALQYRLNISARRNIAAGSSQTVATTDNYAQVFPRTGGDGRMLCIAVSGLLLMIISTVGVAVHTKRKRLGGSSS